MRRRSAKNMIKKCYMCNEPATGTEHVPPKCLFPEKKDIPDLDLRKNLISVPSCDIHNSSKSKDDEYLLFVLISHFENNKVAKRQFKSKTIRALKKNPRLLSIYRRTTKEVILNSQKTFAFQFNYKRIQKELDHIARALYFKEFKTKWRKRIAIHSPAMLALEGKDALTVNYMTQKMATLSALFFADSPKLGENQEVFWYQIHTEPDEQRLLIRMCFYNGVEVIALPDRRLRQSAEPVAQADPG